MQFVGFRLLDLRGNKQMTSEEGMLANTQLPISNSNIELPAKTSTTFINLIKMLTLDPGTILCNSDLALHEMKKSTRLELQPSPKTASGNQKDKTPGAVTHGKFFIFILTLKFKTQNTDIPLPCFQSRHKDIHIDKITQSLLNSNPSNGKTTLKTGMRKHGRVESGSAETRAWVYRCNLLPNRGVWAYLEVKFFPLEKSVIVTQICF